MYLFCQAPNVTCLAMWPNATCGRWLAIMLVPQFIQMLSAHAVTPSHVFIGPSDPLPCLFLSQQIKVLPGLDLCLFLTLYFHPKVPWVNLYYWLLETGVLLIEGDFGLEFTAVAINLDLGGTEVGAHKMLHHAQMKEAVVITCVCRNTCVFACP